MQLPRRLLLLPALVGILAVTAAAAPPGSAAAGTSFAPDQGGFHSVLAYGEGQTVNAADLAGYEAAGTVPSSFTDQVAAYNGLITAAPHVTAADLGRLYKDSSFSQVPADRVESTESPTAGVTVVRDSAHHVPHIYAQTRSAGMYAAGYASAEDRLFLMDVLRRTSEGSTAELLGPSAVPADSAALGQFDRSPAELTAEIDALPAVAGATGARARQDLYDYVAGINGYISATQTDPTKLPAEYAALGALPRPWTVADSASEAYLLISQFTVLGDRTDQQAQILRDLQARVGAQARRVFDDLRRAEDPQAPVSTTTRFRSDDPGPERAAAVAVPDSGSEKDRDAVASDTGPTAPSPALPAWAAELAHHGLPLERHASNALLVGAEHTASGHPVAAMGPQVGYYSPEILLEYELHAPGVDVSGMSFPGASPLPLIGHTRTFAWTGTTANSDNSDTFVESLCTTDGTAPTTRSTSYLYRGRCLPFTSRDQVLHTPLPPTSPTTMPRTVTLRTQRSVHGPVYAYATVAGKPVALTRSTAVYGQGIRSVLAFERLADGSVTGPGQFVAAMRQFAGSENWFYLDSRHIAWLQSGLFQQRARGVSLQLPTWGTGAWDWKGFDPVTHTFTPLPASHNPVSIDPAQGYLVSWNNKAAPGWGGAPGVWSYGPVQRSQLLEKPTVRLLRAGHRVTLPDVVSIAGQASTSDLRATEVLPTMLAALGPVPDAGLRALTRRMAAWAAGGGHRRDTSGSGFLDDGAAVVAFDAWWPRAVRAVFEPALGTVAFDHIDTFENLLAAGAPTHSGFFDNWHGQLRADLDRVLGRPVALRTSRGYCGAGSAAGCRALLARTLREAVAAVAKAQGADPAAWRRPVLCPRRSGACDQIEPVTAGAVATPPQPWQNRGTFHQAVEILRGPGYRVAATGAGRGSSSGPGGASRPVLPATGGSTLGPLLAVLVLGLAGLAGALPRQAGRDGARWGQPRAKDL